MKELIDVKVYVVIFDDFGKRHIEKVCQNESTAIAYCNNTNSELGFNLCYYETLELE